MPEDDVEVFEPMPDEPGGDPKGGEPGPRKGKKGFLSRWVEHRAEKAITKAVSTGAEHIEQRAAKVVGSLYDEKAADLEERAVRALRTAIEAESERIQKTIEHAVEVKKREVRLSLLVLVGAAVVYLVLYWLTHDAPVPA